MTITKDDFFLLEGSLTRDIPDRKESGFLMYNFRTGSLERLMIPISQYDLTVRNYVPLVVAEMYDSILMEGLGAWDAFNLTMEFYEYELEEIKNELEQRS